MDTPTPNFSKEQVELLERAGASLSDLIKSSRAKGATPGNPLEPLIDEVLSYRRTELLEAPLLYQLLFIASVRGTENTLEVVQSLKSKIEETS